MLELLPDVVRTRELLSTGVGFATGVAFMLAIRQSGNRVQARKKGGEPSRTGMVIAVGVDITIDGFLIGINFAAGATQGLLLTVALSLELLGLGLATVTALHQAVASRWRSLGTTAGLAWLVFADATALAQPCLLVRQGMC